MWCQNWFPNTLQHLFIYIPYIVLVVNVSEQLITHSVESSNGKGLHQFDHDGGSDDVDCPQPVEEMLWPFLYYFSESNEIEDGTVNVYHCIAGIVVVIEMIYFLYNVVLQFLSEGGIVSLGVEVEEVGRRLVLLEEDVGVFDVSEVLVEDLLHLLVEVRVV